MVLGGRSVRGIWCDGMDWIVHARGLGYLGVLCGVVQWERREVERQRMSE